jgi:hypothetical protein
MKNTDGLQIGNYLNFKNTNDLAAVYLIHGDNHFDCRDEYGSFIPNGNYEFIKLDANWLEYLGFIKLDTDGYFYIHEDKMGFKVSEDLKMVAWNNLHLDGVKIDYVHQLQNLFYSITNEKLIR